MPALDQDLHNPGSEFLGTAQFLFCEGAVTRAAAAAKGYTDMGNFTALENKGEISTTPILKCFRGVTRESRKLPGIIKQSYDLKTNEVLDYRKLRFALFGSDLADYAQAASAAANGDALAFSAASPAILNLWYPLAIAGAPVREITALTLDALTEGADFVVDGKLGLVRFVNEATLPGESLTPVISAPALTGAHPLGLRRLKPMSRGIWNGYGRLLLWDQETQSLAMDHKDFSASITLSAPFTVANDALAEMTLNVSIGADPGEIFYRA
jgi:hypothetical protein